MTAFADACTRRPFSNGTEGDAWMSKWCNYCTHDHGLHNDREAQPMCSLIGSVMFDDGWPEGWIPEPDDGSFSLPSRLVCTAFTPCHEAGCAGDPGATERAVRITEVTAYWSTR